MRHWEDTSRGTASAPGPCTMTCTPGQTGVWQQTAQKAIPNPKLLRDLRGAVAAHQRACIWTPQTRRTAADLHMHRSSHGTDPPLKGPAGGRGMDHSGTWRTCGQQTWLRGSGRQLRDPPFKRAADCRDELPRRTANCRPLSANWSSRTPLHHPARMRCSGSHQRDFGHASCFTVAVATCCLQPPPPRPCATSSWSHGGFLDGYLLGF